MTLACNPKTRWQMKTMKYYIMTIFPQPIHSIISHFISVIAFTPYSPIKQLRLLVCQRSWGRQWSQQVAYDHPLSINYLSFPLSSKKKNSLIAAQHKNSMFPIQKTANEQIPVLISVSPAEPEGPLTGRGGSVTPLHPQSWRQYGFSSPLEYCRLPGNT